MFHISMNKNILNSARKVAIRQDCLKTSKLTVSYNFYMTSIFRLTVVPFIAFLSLAFCKAML